jgi:hypothetical protein
MLHAHIIISMYTLYILCFICFVIYLYLYIYYRYEIVFARACKGGYICICIYITVTKSSSHVRARAALCISRGCTYIAVTVHILPLQYIYCRYSIVSARSLCGILSLDYKERGRGFSFRGLSLSPFTYATHVHIGNTHSLHIHLHKDVRGFLRDESGESVGMEG